MANFDTYTSRLNAGRQATSILQLIQNIYQSGKQVQAALQLYQSNSDPAFNSAVNAMFNASERNELNQMLGQINTLITDWETNHPLALGA